MKPFAILFLILGSATGRHTVDNSAASVPILVELFTSEGCSSCPPADALLQRMDSSQPIAGAQLIVLSEHVDYWDHEGWKDPYSSHALTDRQRAYVGALGLSTAYTPQMIVDGSSELRLSDPRLTEQVLEKARTAQKEAVRIVSVEVERTSPPVLRARIEAEGESVTHRADIYVAVAFDHAESQVSRGENRDRHLTHVAVVQSFSRIGKVEKGKDFGQEVAVPLMPGTDPANLRVIVFVQEPGPGKVLGATLWNSGK